MSVYFAKVGRYIKVGFSENPERRVKNLWRSATRYSRPWDLSAKEPRQLLLVIDGDKSTEARCHAALGDYCAAGEFYIDEPGVRDFMHLAERGNVSNARLMRPSGSFEPVPWTQMLPERQAEMDAYMARVSARRTTARNVVDQIIADPGSILDDEFIAQLMAGAS